MNFKGWDNDQNLGTFKFWFKQEVKESSAVKKHHQFSSCQARIKIGEISILDVKQKLGHQIRDEITDATKN